MTRFAAYGAAPDVNDLVRVSLGDLDDPDETNITTGSSRIEDVILDKDDRPTEYVVAAPWSDGELEPPAPMTRCALLWTTPRGHCMLPGAFIGQRSTPQGLRVWKIKVTGPARRDERRQFVRVAVKLPVRFDIRHDIEAPASPASPASPPVQELPAVIPVESINISEGGMLCLSRRTVLPADLFLGVHFELEGSTFDYDGYVVWSNPHERRELDMVLSAIRFTHNLHGERLRPLLFRTQLKARRAGLA
jgi:hypothetical protein